MKLHIPFLSRFKEPMLDGVKTMTSRNKKYGEVGDTFEAWGSEFKIIDIWRSSLLDVSSFHWYEEGAQSPEDFIQIWESIHIRKGYDPEQKVWVYQFEIVK